MERTTTGLEGGYCIYAFEQYYVHTFFCEYRRRRCSADRSSSCRHLRTYHQEVTVVSFHEFRSVRPEGDESAARGVTLVLGLLVARKADQALALDFLAGQRRICNPDPDAIPIDLAEPRGVLDPTLFEENGDEGSAVVNYMAVAFRRHGQGSHVDKA